MALWSRGKQVLKEVITRRRHGYLENWLPESSLLKGTYHAPLWREQPKARDLTSIKARIQINPRFLVEPDFGVGDSCFTLSTDLFQGDWIC